MPQIDGKIITQVGKFTFIIDQRGRLSIEDSKEPWISDYKSPESNAMHALIIEVEKTRLENLRLATELKIAYSEILTLNNKD